MATFSQSFNFIEKKLNKKSTPRSLTNTQKLHFTRSKTISIANDSKSDVEVIEESPTRKASKDSCLRSIRERLKNISTQSRKPSKKNKSDISMDFHSKKQVKSKALIESNLNTINFKSTDIQTSQLLQTDSNINISELELILNNVEKNIDKNDSENAARDGDRKKIDHLFECSDFSIENNSWKVRRKSEDLNLFMNEEDLKSEKCCLDMPIFSQDLCNINFSEDSLKITPNIVTMENVVPKNDDFWDDSSYFNGISLNDFKPAVETLASIQLDQTEFNINCGSITDSNPRELPKANETIDNSSKLNVKNELEQCKKDIMNYIRDDSIIDDLSTKSFLKTPVKCKVFTQRLLLNSSTAENTNTNKTILGASLRDRYKTKSISRKRLKLISSWDLPVTILQEYERKGIVEMFDWQADCLKNEKVIFENRNLVYCAPTSAGKTLVSEILMIKNVLERKKKSLLILPFISVVREKTIYLQDLLISTGFRVDGFYGGYSPPGGFDKVQVAICTIEKANAIINKLLEEQKLDDIGIVVVDEIHLLSDPSRGYILELLLAKILYMCRKYNHKIQIVSMSATLPNLELLQKWLDAEFYHTNFRPVQLHEMLKIDNKIYSNKMELIRQIDPNELSHLTSIRDQDNIGLLCLETLAQKCSVIVFCPSKDWCEKLCLHIAEIIYNAGKSSSKWGSEIRQTIDIILGEEVKQQLRNCPAGLDSILEKTVSYSCAFHHAGLTSDERDIIESSFKSGSLRVIVATSTLSSGVNLPARRVIIRTPLFGGTKMNSLTYKQMIGRAGRTGKDTLGEAILICSEANSKIGKELISSELASLSSCLDVNSFINLKRAILEIIASGVATTKDDLKLFFHCTLLHMEKFNDSVIQINPENCEAEDSSPESNIDPIENCLEFLTEYEFIRLQLNEEKNEMNFIATKLGHACLASSLPPSDGLLLFSELQKSRQCFVLESELHAVYLVTPYSVCHQFQELDWLGFLDLWEKLSPAMRRVGELVGVKDAFLVKAMRGISKLDYKFLQIHKRFYIALALQELINEIPICIVSAKYKCSRGLLQTLQQMASTFAGIVTSFCNSLNWSMLALLISQFKERLFFGIHRDLIDLMRIPNLNSQRARALYDQDIKNLLDLAQSDVLTVEKILCNSICFESEKKRDEENEYDFKQRCALRTLFVTGRSGLTIREAAYLLIQDARKFLELEMRLTDVNWKNASSGIVSFKDDFLKNRKRSSEINSTNLSPPKIIKTHLLSQDCLNMSEEYSQVISENRSFDEVPSSQVTVLDELKSLKKTQNSRLLRLNHQKTKAHISEEIVQNLQIDKAFNDIGSISFQFSQISRFSDSEFHPESTSIAHIMSGSKTECKNDTVFDHLNIIDVCGDKKLFRHFVKLCWDRKEMAVALGVNRLENNRTIIGGNLLPHQKTMKHSIHCKIDEERFVAGIGVCLMGNTIFYINLQDKDSNVVFEEKLDFLVELFGCTEITLKMYEAKEQCKALSKAVPNIQVIQCKLEDPKVANWLLQPEVLVDLKYMVRLHAVECISIVDLGGTESGYYGIGLAHDSTIPAKIRASVEGCVTLHVLKNQLKNLHRIGKETIVKSFYEIEMPIQKSLFKMEMVGFSASQKEMIKLIKALERIMKDLQQYIFELHGRKFNLTSSKEVAKILGLQNNVNSKKNPSTSKQILDKIATPLSHYIIQYRKLGATLNKTLHPLLRSISDGRIYGNSISFTSTGRITMQEPNLQNITKNFEIIFNGQLEMISCRSVFQPIFGRCLISADFCQLELRILTHMSQDPTLMKIMNSEQDVFKSIAAKWNRVSEEQVTESMRNNSKQICYGIIYGMGSKSLSEALKVDEQVAMTMTEEFHQTYPAIRLFAGKIVRFAQQTGYVETLFGRRRYLPQLTSDDKRLISQAERQAINTTIQGSAADIAKKAILRMERYLKKYEDVLQINLLQHNDSAVALVLHLHDELIYEVPSDKATQIGKILKYSMENCVSLKVPLHAKVKCGRSWGEMSELQV